MYGIRYDSSVCTQYYDDGLFSQVTEYNMSLLFAHSECLWGLFSLVAEYSITLSFAHSIVKMVVFIGHGMHQDWCVCTQ